jgi:hypothetical protein
MALFLCVGVPEKEGKASNVKEYATIGADRL